MVVPALFTLEDLIKFPSPCGDVVLKSEMKILLSREFVKFPSPCGDVVLKLFAPPVFGIDSDGFRPLAGMWF